MGDILKSIAKIYSKADETGVIMSDTVLLACGCTPVDIKTLSGYQQQTNGTWLYQDKFNTQTALDEAIARERAKSNIQEQDQGLEL